MMNLLSSLGIIGGADGPTAILVSSGFGSEMILAVSVVLTIISFGMIRIRRKKN